MQRWNHPAWDRARPGFYEVWFWKLNPQPGQSALWVRMTILSGLFAAEPVAEVWGIFSEKTELGTRHITVRQTFPATAFTFSGTRIAIGPSFWSDGITEGDISGGGNRIEWQLRFEPNQRAFEHVPKLLRSMHLSRSVVVTPNPDLRFTGTFRINSRSYSCNASHGMQGHLYGNRYARSWQWAHCNLADDDTPFVFEALTARIRLAGVVPTPPLSVFYLELDGERHIFTSIADILRARSRTRLNRWDFTATRRKLMIDGRLETGIFDFAGIRYRDIDGSTLYCHNSKLATLTLTVFRRGKPEHRIASGSAAFEIVQRQPIPGIEVLL